MKRGKKFLSALLAACLLLGLLPGPVLAADPVKVRNEQLDLTGAAASSSDSGEGWRWDADTTTLTLSGARIESAEATGIRLPVGAKIYLEARTTSTVTSAGATAGNDPSYGVYCEAGLTIEGSGTLEVTSGDATGGNSYGIYGKSGVTVTDSAHVIATGGAASAAYGKSYGIYSDEISGVTLEGSCNVTAIGGMATVGSHGIFAKDEQAVTISDSAHVTAKGGTVTKQDNGGVYHEGSSGITTGGDKSGGTISISGGTVEAVGGQADGSIGKSRGIGSENITIGDGAHVGATGGTAGNESLGIDVDALTVSGNRTSVTAIGGEAVGSNSYGVYAAKTIEISDASVRATGGTAKGTKCRSMGIWAFDGDIKISGAAEVIAIGGTAAAQSIGLGTLKKGLEISGTAHVDVTSGEANNSYGVLVCDESYATFTVSGEVKLNVQSGTAVQNSYAIQANGTMTVSGSADISAVAGAAGSESIGINANYNSENGGRITLSSSGTVTARGGAATNGTSSGIRTIQAKITGGVVTATGDLTAGTGNYGINISGGSSTTSSLSITGGIVQTQGKKGGMSRWPNTLTDCVLIGKKTQADAWELLSNSVSDYAFIETRPSVKQIQISPASVAVVRGRTQQFNATIELQDDTRLQQNSLVKWTVKDNEDVGTTISDGLLTVAAGETAATVTVTAQSYADTPVTASATVTIKQAESGGSSSSSGSSGENQYTITASAGNNGEISPSGTVRVRRGDSQAFRIQPNTGYEVYDVLVDDKSVGAAETYTFEQVRGGHTIKALFVPSYTDVTQTAWYREAARDAAFHGILVGTAPGRFSPEQEMSRAMFATVLYRMAGEPALTDEARRAPFTDVDTESWYGAAVCWAWAQDVVNGVAEDTFRPDDPVTREQFVAMLHRYAGQPAANGTLSGFYDGAQAGAWATDALCWAVEQDLLRGNNDGGLAPQSQITRAEAAAILMRYLRNT